MKTYSKGQTHVKFSVQLVDNDNPYNIVPLDLDGYTELKIIFRKPDGTIIEKDASVSAGRPLTDTEIEYVDNDPAGSILDHIGKWRFTGYAKNPSNSTQIKGVTRRLFRVKA